jgi:hypothetical protein
MLNSAQSHRWTYWPKGEDDEESLAFRLRPFLLGCQFRSDSQPTPSHERGLGRDPGPTGRRRLRRAHGRTSRGREAAGPPWREVDLHRHGEVSVGRRLRLVLGDQQLLHHGQQLCGGSGRICHVRRRPALVPPVCRMRGHLLLLNPVLRRLQRGRSRPNDVPL